MSHDKKMFRQQSERRRNLSDFFIRFNILFVYMHTHSFKYTENILFIIFMSHKYNLINSVNFLEFIVLSLYTFSLNTSVPLAFCTRLYAIRALFCCLCCAHTHEIYFCRFSAFLISSEKGRQKYSEMFSLYVHFCDALSVISL